jgi:hypothetical protein
MAVEGIGAELPRSLRGGEADEAIQPLRAAYGLLRFARNDEEEHQVEQTWAHPASKQKNGGAEAPPSVSWT